MAGASVVIVPLSVFCTTQEGKLTHPQAADGQPARKGAEQLDSEGGSEEKEPLPSEWQRLKGTQ
ncbi:MAG: hypothetical protein CVV19_03595 [Gammaproteobacteria bacterium HGW-Gammaproteobacteria-9]|nr:MAG: hypothetical protein CVV19_03595 [Gammaproteobacteria bacterium HGW-Gammaproteobacteria-9]